MRLNGLMEPLNNSSEFNNLLKNIESRKYPIGVFGLSESAKSYLIDGIFEAMDKSILIVTHSDAEARNIYEDLSLYTTQAFYFPIREIVFYNVDAISGDIRWERLKVIREMLRPGKKIIVTCVEALAAAYIPVELYKDYLRTYSVGDSINLSELNEKLIQCGYERVESVDGKGEFSIRGGILDIFTPESIYPYRVELFGDEIDSIRTFSVETQRSIDKVQSMEIFPAKEIILDSGHRENGIANIKNDLEKFLKGIDKKKNKEIYEKINTIINGNIEALSERWGFETIDSYLPYFYGKTSNIMEFMDNKLVIVDDAQRCKGKLDSTYFEFEESFKSLLQRGTILPMQSKLIYQEEEINSILQGSDVITINAITKTMNFLAPASIISFSEVTLSNYHGQLDFLIDEIRAKKSQGYKTVILSGTRPRGERLVDTLRKRGIESSYKDTVNSVSFGEIVITFGNQLKGFDYPELRVCVISDKEVFGESKRKITHKAKKGAGKIKSFTELKIGDYVVHSNHGIGIYKGIRQLEVEGLKRDYLELWYQGQDKLYVPVEQLDLVQKYIGSEGKIPKINKLGGTEWTKTKSRVQKSINEIAEELVKLYATRSLVKGFTYSKDTVWQKQFEEEFPYEETADQVVAIEDIKKDMQSDSPMDRLLCGDVGYGKTEVAVRAAFKAVMDGKQVAFLVPTTILAEQHYNNFIRRFSDFPVKIDMVSRFRTPAQQKETIKALKAGNVDIIIGTHRILQKDVQFKDLGLLIVDEEQRFGVTHKEKIKNLKKNVDVLTLTATPIPRTLHMSLVGVRDISIIETPPEERYPIQTYVVEFNEQLIRDAIIREISRGGQVYFVYNRVENISDISAFVSKLVPEARVGIAHGQMTERELENVMADFMNKELDILVCTTIIETGIDIPNVNTMIIYDADKMGLSQLYQLRGRVGRSNRIAYAYFTYTKDKVLTEVAEKRLKAIKEFTELGSGFKIALRDLEIRGAGNMMGAAQHGHMAAVGYDLYCRMLEDMIKLIKGEIEKEPVETTVELKINAYIPNEYISDEVQKIEIYKKIAAIDSFEDMKDTEDEIVDRFSDIPAAVYNLMKIAYLRSIAKKLGIEDIKEEGDEVVFVFQDSERLTNELIKGVITRYRRYVNFRPGSRQNQSNKPILLFRTLEIKHEEIVDKLIDLLQYMKSVVEIS